MRRLLILIALPLAFAAAGCGDDNDDSGSDSTAPTPRADTGAQTQTQAEAPPTKVDGCTEVAQPQPKKDGGQEKPTAPLTGEYTVTFKTNCGSFTIEMDEATGGLSAASFVQLAKSGFYTNTFFHRIAVGFVIQGGDPLGTGIGGPGYTTKDPPPSNAQYPLGTVAMAKGGQEPPGSSGSQFFVMTGDGGLPPEYAIVGKVSKGLGVVKRIGKFGDAAEQPTRVVKIEKATVSGG